MAVKKKSAAVKNKTTAPPVANHPVVSTVPVDEVSVRMYCHGFGDCFLLTFSGAGQPVYRMLIDCGMLTGSQSILGDCIENIKKECGGHIHLVVQTHEHKDHISGFNLKDKNRKLIWDDIAVDNIWFAWTENTDPGGDDLAINLKEKFKKKKKALAKALGLYGKYINSDAHASLMNTDPASSMYHSAQQRYAEALQQMLNFYGIDEREVRMASRGEGELGLTMKDAMRYFIDNKGKGKRDISYWNPGECADSKTTGLQGVKFYFLGPPKDYNLLRKMDDKEHVEMYLTDLGVSDNYYLALSEGGESFSPFHDKYRWDGKLLYPEDRKEDPDFVWKLYRSPKNKWRDITADWLQDAGSLALALDSYTNNTSLVMAIELEASGKVLLFPADAQIGNWISWTKPAKEGDKDPAIKWESADANGSKKTVTVTDLLKRTVFYKVGHHASHNATARKHGLELMTSEELVAMIPVDEEVAKRQGKKGWEMPAKDLYRRLQEATRGRIIRLDKGNILDDDLKEIPKTALPTETERQAFNRNVTASKTIIQVDDNKRRPMYWEYKLKA